MKLRTWSIFFKTNFLTVSQEMSSSSDMELKMDKPASKAPKTTVVKKTAAIIKPAVKDTSKTAAKGKVKPSDVKKAMFAPNTLVGFANSYYRSLGKQTITFTRKHKKVTERAKTIEPKACPAIACVRKAYETVKDGENVNDLIMDPYVHTAYEFIEKAKKAKKEEKNIDAAFRALCESYGIIENKNDELQILINNMTEFIKDRSKINGRIFNYVFGPVYSEKHPTKEEVHMRYIQRAPEDLIDILKMKLSHFDWSVDEFFTNPNGIVRKTISDDKVSSVKAIMELVKSKTKGNARAEITKLLGEKNAKPSAIAEMQKSISHIRTCYSFINYLAEIDDKKQFKTLVDKVNTLADDFDTCASDIEKIQKKSIKSKDTEEVWQYLITIVARLASIISKLSTPTKNGKEKLPLTLLCTALHKSGCNLNIKNKKLRDDINKLALGTYTDRAAVEIAKAHTSAIDQVVTPSAYNQYNPELYSKLGFILMEGWSYTKPIVKVNKSMRIAVGLALFKYVDAEVAKLTYDKPNAKIVIDF